MKILIGALVGAVVVFTWSFVSWTVLHLHDSTIKTLTLEQEKAVVAGLQPNVLEDGAYFLPSVPGRDADAAATEAWEQRCEQGPIGFLAYRKAGARPMSVGTLILGFVIDLVGAFVVCMLLSMSGLHSFFLRFGAVGLIGLFAGIVTQLSEANWMYFPLDFSVLMAADTFIGWTVAGLFMAMIVRPRA